MKFANFERENSLSLLISFEPVAHSRIRRRKSRPVTDLFDGQPSFGGSGEPKSIPKESGIGTTLDANAGNSSKRHTLPSIFK